jgi:hypothetical protein
MKQINIVAFLIKFPNFIKLHLIFHILLLEPYYESIIFKKVLEPSPPIEINGEQKYEMELFFILGCLIISYNISSIDKVMTLMSEHGN